MALFVPAILINIISFGFKVISLNVYEVRGLYAFNQYIYAIIVAYLVFWMSNLENRAAEIVKTELLYPFEGR